MSSTANNVGGGAKEDLNPSKRVCVEEEATTTTKFSSQPTAFTIFVCKDGVEVKVPLEHALQAQMVKNAYGTLSGEEAEDGSGSEEEDENKEEMKKIMVESISADTMKEIATYMKHHAETKEFTDIPTIVPSQTLSDFVKDPFDVQFVSPKTGESNKDHTARMTELVKAADFISHEKLTLLVCASFATKLKGYSFEEAKKNLGVDPNTQFTEADKARVLKENPWLEKEL